MMVPHAENRMAPLNAKTILIIDELRYDGEGRERGAGTTKEKESGTGNVRTSYEEGRNEGNAQSSSNCIR